MTPKSLYQAAMRKVAPSDDWYQNTLARLAAEKPSRKRFVLHPALVAAALVLVVAPLLLLPQGQNDSVVLADEPSAAKILPTEQALAAAGLPLLTLPPFCARTVHKPPMHPPIRCAIWGRRSRLPCNR